MDFHLLIKSFMSLSKKITVQFYHFSNFHQSRFYRLLFEFPCIDDSKQYPHEGLSFGLINSLQST